MGLALAGLFCLQSIVSLVIFTSLHLYFASSLGEVCYTVNAKRQRTVLGLHHVGRLQLTVYLYLKCCILLLTSPHIFIRTRQAIMNLRVRDCVHTHLHRDMGRASLLVKKRETQPYFILRKERSLLNKVTCRQILTLQKTTYNTSQASLRMDSKGMPMHLLLRCIYIHSHICTSESKTLCSPVLLTFLRQSPSNSKWGRRRERQKWQKNISLLPILPV